MQWNGQNIGTFRLSNGDNFSMGFDRPTPGRITITCFGNRGLNDGPPKGTATRQIDATSSKDPSPVPAPAIGGY